MNKDAIIKHHLAPITLIEMLALKDYGTLDKPTLSIHGIRAKMEPYRKGFSISWKDDFVSFRGKHFELGKTIKKVGLQIKGYDLVFKDIYIRAHHTSDEGPVISASVGYYKTAGFSESRLFYHRVIIPLAKNLNMHYQIAFSSFITDLGFSSSNGTVGSVNGDKMQVCVVEHNNKHYLSIDSPIKQAYSLFSEKVHAVKNAIGYLTGYLPSDAGYFFAYTQKDMKVPAHFYFNEWRDSIISSYQPVYANPFAFIRDKKLSDKMYKKKLLRPLKQTEFSSICQKLYDSKAFTGIVILILEASIASLVFMPGGFAIAMESLAELLTAPLKDKIAPIKTPALSKKVRKECLAIINKECADLPEEDLKVLTGRIDQLNQVTNKRRLRIPFEQLNITLTERDLAVIDTRNDFLHGRIPDITHAGIDRTEKREGLDLYYASMRFYTLLNRLILKWIGYENYVLNHAKIQEEATLIKLKEPYYFQD